MAKTFEYRVITSADTDDDEETMLNDMGGEGWELVSVHVSEVTYIETEGEGSEDESEEFVEEVATYYLKREKAA